MDRAFHRPRGALHLSLSVFSISSTIFTVRRQSSNASPAAMRIESDGVPQDLQRATTLFQSACDAKEPGGCVGLARLYVTGALTPPNDSSARLLFRQACRDNDANGCFQLARMYETGQHAIQDFGRASSWYRSGCELGHGESCFMLSALYEKGAGVPRIPEESARLKQEACEIGRASCREWQD